MSLGSPDHEAWLHDTLLALQGCVPQTQAGASNEAMMRCGTHPASISGKVEATKGRLVGESSQQEGLMGEKHGAPCLVLNTRVLGVVD